jgi:DNA-binding response OmpR family regulator
VDASAHSVLVVDDDASIRFLCRVNLELAGWNVQDAATIEEARVLLQRGVVDVVLLDVHVGRASGLDFLAEIRSAHPGLPVALLTGSVGGGAEAEHGADAIVAKPFSPQRLTETVHALATRTAPQAG